MQAGVIPIDTSGINSEFQKTWNRVDAAQWDSMPEFKRRLIVNCNRENMIVWKRYYQVFLTKRLVGENALLSSSLIENIFFGLPLKHLAILDKNQT
ncbi:hypothetical protein [Pleionea sp. CnH1-48]|uniref:hypothetical protein n=1 Tax=Pleionea sp. CnH1-48 TaxID=2954494 RepID=UPI002096A1D5|nr:hypothetical protein [Pleionea sp. CnH1-48]MCO7227543.1 hypothetical protein [Pleionea sp. CnH1-48]